MSHQRSEGNVVVIVGSDAPLRDFGLVGIVIARAACDDVHEAADDGQGLGKNPPGAAGGAVGNSDWPGDLSKKKEEPPPPWESGPMGLR